MSAPRLQVKLTPAADKTLLELRSAPGIPSRTRDRAEMLRLNHRGWKTEEIADYLDCQVATVRKAIHRWQQDGLYGLWDSPRSGRPVTWSTADIEHLIEKIETSAETFNSRQLAQELEEARSVKLSRRQLRRVLKKKISVEADSAKPSQATRPTRAIAKTS